LLADARFVLPPKLELLAARMLGDSSGDEVGEIFLCASWAAVS
jgi:hypothetical protein